LKFFIYPLDNVPKSDRETLTKFIAS